MESKRESKVPESKINTAIFREHIKQKYKSIVNGIDAGIQDNKILCADPSLIDMIRLAFTKEDLGVAKVMPLKEDSRFDVKHVIFFTPPTVSNMNKIVSLIKQHQDKCWYIIFVPRRTFDCKEALESGGVYGSILGFYEFNFDLYPLDEDLLSMEIPDAARMIYSDLDTTPLALIAESLQRLQLVFGRIDCIFGKGNSVPIVMDMVKNLENESKIKPDDTMKGEIDCCLIFARNVDFITPLLTQATYEGMLDEVFGIRHNNTIVLEKRFFPFLPQQQKLDGGTMLHRLLSDIAFKDIRDIHFSAIGEILGDKLTEIKNIEATNPQGRADQLEKERKLREMGVNEVAAHIEIQQYLDKLMQKPLHYKTVKTEQGIIDRLFKSAEMADYIEQQICKQVPIARALRLMCLQSIVGDGFKQSMVDSLKKNFIQAYGFEHTLTLSNLEKANLIRADGDKRWAQQCEQLHLINPELGDLKNPLDSGFAYEGFKPILCRLVEQIFLKDGWNAIRSNMAEMYGVTVYDEKKGNLFSNKAQRQTILVYLIGGITYGEIAVLRYLGRKYNKEILIATTSIINGDKFISTFIEKFNK